MEIKVDEERGTVEGEYFGIPYDDGLPSPEPKFRKLATIRVIEEIQPIEGADKIVKARIGGWWVVTAIDNGFNVGDLVVYFEIDSWVPDSVAPFLSKGGIPKEYNGVPGARLRTIKLRGQVSQGLIMPVKYSENGGYYIDHIDGNIQNVSEGQDVTEALGIQKYEKPVPGQLAGQVRGSFPSFIRKTDQERCQNLVRDIFEKHKDEKYEVTLKLDGSSMTVYYNHEFGFDHSDCKTEVGVCSRNMNLKLDQEGNTYVDVAKNSGLIQALYDYGYPMAIQGELMGPGIQGNREGFSEHKFYVFDIWDIEKQKYMTPDERHNIINRLRVDFGVDIYWVPVVYFETNLSDISINNIEEMLSFADGASINNEVREGLVFKSHDSNFTFKAISNKFLLKGGED